MRKRNAIAWKEMEALLVRLGEKLKRPTTLVVIGSSVCMMLGQPGRATMDIDVLRRNSVFDLGDLRAACEECGIEFNPVGYDEPDDLYLQLIEPGIVQLGVFNETESILRSGNLDIRRPPLENLIASKLVRGEMQDFDDCAFLIRKCRVRAPGIRKAIDSIEDDVSREVAMDNLSMIEVTLLAPQEPAPKARRNPAPDVSCDVN